MRAVAAGFDTPFILAEGAALRSPEPETAWLIERTTPDGIPEWLTQAGYWHTDANRALRIHEQDAPVIARRYPGASATEHVFLRSPEPAAKPSAEPRYTLDEVLAALYDAEIDHRTKFLGSLSDILATRLRSGGATTETGEADD
jgi:hypothetical protein